MSSQTGRYWLGAIIAVALAGIAIWQVWLNQPEPASDPVEIADVPAIEGETVSVVAEDTAPLVQNAAEVETVEEPEPTDVAEAVPAEDSIVEEGATDDVAEADTIEDSASEEVTETEVVTVPAPSLDTFRVESDGQSVLAGRAGPGAVLDILVGGEVIERITTDAAGSFFTFLDLEPSDTSRSLTLIADPDGAAVEMAQTYFIEPFGVEEAPADIAEATLVPGAIAPLTEAEDREDATETIAESEDNGASTEATDTVLAEVTPEVVEEAPAEGVADATDETVVEEDLTETASTKDAPVIDGDENQEIAETAEPVISDNAPTIENGSEIASTLVEADEQVASTDLAETEATEELIVTEEADVSDAPETEESIVVAEAIEEIFGDALEPEPTAPSEEVAAIEPQEIEAPTQPDVVAEQSPTVLEVDDTGVRVVSSGPVPQALSQVALDTITYDPEGEVLIAGRASTDGFVQVYIDNQPITTSRITKDRNWSTDLPEVDTGIYTLRIDELDSEGTVVSRLETPFKREEPETVAAVMAEETSASDFEVAVKTVQPGATLWAIAREKYGRGILYVAVYEANQDLIRDPDLIYPGQIFVLPELDPETGE